MELTRHFARQFAYDDWANRETLAALRVASPPAAAVKLFAHIVACERLWLERARSVSQSVAVWPEWSVSQAESQLASVTHDWRAFVNGLEAPQLAQPVAYVNSQGEKWVSALSDVLAHVVLHGSYHRGQIASHLRAAQHAPAYTDYIHCTRNGWI